MQNQYEGSYLIIHSPSATYRYFERGIKRLWLAATSDEKILLGATVEDSVVGRAAALLMVYGGVKEVHAGMLSEGGKAVLEEYNVPFTCKQLVDRILNRARTDSCPMEKAVEGCTPALSVAAIRSKLLELGIL